MQDNENKNKPDSAPSGAPRANPEGGVLVDAPEGVNADGTTTGGTDTPPVNDGAAREQEAEAVLGAKVASDFARVKQARVEEAVKVMAAEGVIYEAAYLLSLPSIRDAADEVELSGAIMKTTARLVKQNKDVKITGGKAGMEKMGSDIVTPTSTAGLVMWKCPNCGAHNQAVYLNDESQTHEYCRMCSGTAVRRDYAHNLHRIVKDGKTVGELRQEQQQQEDA